VDPFPRLYPIIDTAACRGRGLDPLKVAEGCLEGGAAWLQLRAKEESGAEMLALADALVSLASRYRARVIVNDRADVASMSRAAGVHVGQGDLPVEDARRLVGEAGIVGVSTHDRAQVDAALETSASYVAVGPVFGTATKDTGYEAVGLELVSYAAGRGKPIVAIGGITPARAPSVIAAGAHAVSVISAVLTGDPGAGVRECLQALR
jgi:thiamine-phosphate pyrophosphorylase